MISDQEAEEMIKFVKRLRQQVEAWIAQEHPNLPQWSLLQTKGINGRVTWSYSSYGRGHSSADAIAPVIKSYRGQKHNRNTVSESITRSIL